MLVAVELQALAVHRASDRPIGIVMPFLAGIARAFHIREHRTVFALGFVEVEACAQSAFNVVVFGLRARLERVGHHPPLVPGIFFATAGSDVGFVFVFSVFNFKAAFAHVVDITSLQLPNLFDRREGAITDHDVLI